jgi:hypothetical protein
MIGSLDPHRLKKTLDDLEASFLVLDVEAIAVDSHSPCECCEPLRVPLID